MNKQEITEKACFSFTHLPNVWVHDGSFCIPFRSVGWFCGLAAEDPSKSGINIQLDSPTSDVDPSGFCFTEYGDDAKQFVKEYSEWQSRQP